MCEQSIVLARVLVAKDGVWIGESIYWIFLSRNYNYDTMKIMVIITHNEKPG
jgi:hypothetical protein